MSNQTKILTDEEMSKDLFRVVRQKGTEAPFTGKYWDSHEQGMYVCAVCESRLFSSDAKFDSGTGWPSFIDPVNLEHIILRPDLSDGLVRTEVLCKNCNAHLGHVFDDLPRHLRRKVGGPKDKGGKRYCINSVCLRLEKK